MDLGKCVNGETNYRFNDYVNRFILTLLCVGINYADFSMVIFVLKLRTISVLNLVFRFMVSSVIGILDPVSNSLILGELKVSLGLK